MTRFPRCPITLARPAPGGRDGDTIGPMRLAELVATSRRVALTRARGEKIGALADLLRRLPPEEVEIAVSYLSGSLRQGRIGLGPAAVKGALAAASPATQATLELAQVDEAFSHIAAASGAGS